MERTMAQEGSKPPIPFVVLSILDQEVVWPPVGTGTAGGNSVSVTNTLDKPLTVTHGGHLDAADPFTVPARGQGGPPRVTHAIKPQSDVSGTIFQLHIEASVVRAFGIAGDPTIIIL
jgi:hypothetical protein